MNRTQYIHKTHSVYCLNFHLVLVTKYRKKVIDVDVFRTIKQAIDKISNIFDIKCIEINHDKDHIHILFTAPPKICLSNYICVLKAYSSRLIRAYHTKIKTRLYGNHFWSPSYCLLSCGGASIDVVEKYIRNQGGQNDK